MVILSERLRMPGKFSFDCVVSFPEHDSFPKYIHAGRNILEMNFTFYDAASHGGLLNLRVIYIYCEACEIWIKNRYWYNRRSEWRWTDPFKDLHISGRKMFHRKIKNGWKTSRWSFTLKIFSSGFVIALFTLLQFPPCVREFGESVYPLPRQIPHRIQEKFLLTS